MQWVAVIFAIIAAFALGWYCALKAQAWLAHEEECACGNAALCNAKRRGEA
jgi:hypothetical protein